MKAGKVVAAVVAGMVALISVGLLVGGGALVWAFGVERDADGFLTSPEYQLDSLGYALVSTEVDLVARPGDWWPTSGVADVRLDVEAVEPPQRDQASRVAQTANV